MVSEELLQAVAVTAELCGRTFSEPAARVFVMDLSRYPEHQVIKALSRCRKEVRGLLTVSDVVSRLEDGRPGVEEAWAMLPRNESASCVWTAEMREAYAVAAPLIAEGDEVAARMAFKEVYTRQLIDAREEARPAEWQPSLGTDLRGREAAISAAIEKGRITPSHAAGLLPAPESAAASSVIAGLIAAPAGSRIIPPHELKQKIAEFKAGLLSKERK